VIEVTFKGEHLLEVRTALEKFLRDIHPALQAAPTPPVQRVQGPGPDIFEAVDKPVEKPAEKPVEKRIDAHKNVAEKQKAAAVKRERTEKQRENDEKLRIAAKAKAAEKKAAREAAASTASMMPMPPPPKTAEGMDPAEVVRLREKVLEELRAAYGNGYQNEVFELLSRFGNGAKSFRELPPESFVPIREAIDNGALT